MKTSNFKTDNKEKNQAEKTYSGVAIDVADNEKVDKTLVKDATSALNNNHAGDNDFDASQA